MDAVDDLITNGNEVIREIRRLLPSVRLVAEALNGDAENHQKMVNRKQVEKLESLEAVLAEYRGRLETMETQVKQQATVIKKQAEQLKERDEVKKVVKKEKEDLRAKLRKTEEELKDARKKLERKEEPFGFLQDLISFGDKTPGVTEDSNPEPLAPEPASPKPAAAKPAKTW